MDAPSFSKGYLPAVGTSAQRYDVPATTNVSSVLSRHH